MAIEKGRLLTRVVDMEEKLRASERLSALGLLAAEIAHEIRNPLTVMQMLFHALVETLQMDATSQRDAELISEKMRQMNRILDQVLSLRPLFRQPIKEAVDAQRNSSTTSFSSPATNCSSRASISAAPSPKIFRPSALTARRSSRSSSTSFSTPPTPCRRAELLRLSAVPEEFDGKPHLAISVRDNGQGMSAEQLANLFAPFLTYKESGTGIGLAIVKKIMENHQGKVQVESKVGQGTRFKLLFPIVDPQLRPRNNVMPSGAHHGQKPVAESDSIRYDAPE